MNPATLHHAIESRTGCLWRVLGPHVLDETHGAHTLERLPDGWHLTRGAHRIASWPRDIDPWVLADGVAATIAEAAVSERRHNAPALPGMETT